MIDKFKLVDTKLLDEWNFQMFEGKFKDLSQESDIYIYANVSNFNTETFEESDIYIYSHSFEELTNAEDYDITANFSEDFLKGIKESLLDEYEQTKKRVL